MASLTPFDSLGNSLASRDGDRNEEHTNALGLLCVARTYAQEKPESSEKSYGEVGYRVRFTLRNVYVTRKVCGSIPHGTNLLFWQFAAQNVQTAPGALRSSPGSSLGLRLCWGVSCEGRSA
jgi:hypothetical protein